MADPRDTFHNTAPLLPLRQNIIPDADPAYTLPNDPTTAGDIALPVTKLHTEPTLPEEGP